LSPSSSVPLLAKILTQPATRSLCDSWASWWNSCCHRPTSPQSVPSAAYEGWKITQGARWIM